MNLKHQRGHQIDSNHVDVSDDKCYIFVPRKYRMHDAELYCQELGGELLWIDNEVEQRWITKYTRERKLNKELVWLTGNIPLTKHIWSNAIRFQL